MYKPTSYDLAFIASSYISVSLRESHNQTIYDSKLCDRSTSIALFSFIHVTYKLKGWV